MPRIGEVGRTPCHRFYRVGRSNDASSALRRACSKAGDVHFKAWPEPGVHRMRRLAAQSRKQEAK